MICSHFVEQNCWDGLYRGNKLRFSWMFDLFVILPVFTADLLHLPDANPFAVVCPPPSSLPPPSYLTSLVGLPLPPQSTTDVFRRCFWRRIISECDENWTWNSEYLYETVHFNSDHAIYCSTQPVLLFPILQDTHCIYQSVGSFAVYLLTLSAEVCLNGNSGNKQYSWGGCVHGRAEFWLISALNHRCLRSFAHWSDVRNRKWNKLYKYGSHCFVIKAV